jgi:hypothetical protein
MKSDIKKIQQVKSVAKSNIDKMFANNKTHHLNGCAPAVQRKTTIETKDIFSLNYCYDDFFTKLIH